MGKIIPLTMAKGLVSAGKARAETLVYDENRGKTYVAITRFDEQTTAHAPIGFGDLRNTEQGDAAEADFGIQR